MEKLNEAVLGRVHSFSLSDFKAAVRQGRRLISGYANAATIDRSNEIVEPNAFASSLPKFMANPIVFYNHDWDEAIGKVVNAKITSLGLYVDIEIGEGFEPADSVWAQIQQGILKAFSIGFRPIVVEYDDEHDLLTIKDMELFEISVVTIPMNAESLFEVSENRVTGMKMRDHGSYISYKSFADKLRNTNTERSEKMETVGYVQVGTDTAVDSPDTGTTITLSYLDSPAKIAELEASLAEAQATIASYIEKIGQLEADLTSEKASTALVAETLEADQKAFKAKLAAKDLEIQTLKVKNLFQSVDLPNLIRPFVVQS